MEGMERRNRWDGAKSRWEKAKYLTVKNTACRLRSDVALDHATDAPT